MKITLEFLDSNLFFWSVPIEGGNCLVQPLSRGVFRARLVVRQVVRGITSASELAKD